MYAKFEGVTPFLYNHHGVNNAIVGEHAKDNNAFLVQGKTTAVECINSKSEIMAMFIQHIEDLKK